MSGVTINDEMLIWGHRVAARDRLDNVVAQRWQDAGDIGAQSVQAGLVYGAIRVVGVNLWPGTVKDHLDARVTKERKAASERGCAGEAMNEEWKTVRHEGGRIARLVERKLLLR